MRFIKSTWKDVDLNPNISLIALSENLLKLPIKRQGSSDWINEWNLNIYCLEETHSKCKDVEMLKVKHWRKLYWVNIIFKNSGVILLIPDEVNLNAQSISRGRDIFHNVRRFISNSQFVCN